MLSSTDRLPSDLQLKLRPVMLVVAHPDDEAVGLGSRLAEFRNLRAIIHVTDGAPRTGDDFRRAGFDSTECYARARKAEFHAAMQELKMRPHRTFCFNCPDQQARERIDIHARRLAILFAQLRPAYVFTHSYEGGHPDHDAIALSVHMATSMVRRRGSEPPLVIEFASYHNSPQGIETERFLSRRGMRVRHRPLSATRRQEKQRLFAVYRSQRPILDWFPALDEPLRCAPKHDFTKPPHRGRLLYETFGWNFTGAEFCRLARRALHKTL